MARFAPSGSPTTPMFTVMFVAPGSLNGVLIPLNGLNADAASIDCTASPCLSNTLNSFCNAFNSLCAVFELIASVASKNVVSAILSDTPCNF
jgi:hypothetical protein